MLRLLRALGPARSSDLCGAIARSVGPLLPVSRVADDNLGHALPALDRAGRRPVIRQVWEMLGRNAGELPHLAVLGRTEAGPGFEVEGEAVLHALRAEGRPVLFVSAHCGNWEMILPIAAKLGFSVAGFYRPATNRAVDQVVQAEREAALGPGVKMFRKGEAGARAAFGHLARGGWLGMLVDQKLNEGIASPFFGRDAMTTTAPAQFARHFGCALVPVRVDRLGPARLRLVVEAPMDLPATADRAADVAALTASINARIEAWVRADPGNWLWLHRRWPAFPKPPG